MIDTNNSKLREMTLSQLLVGDSPQLPRREVPNLVNWWDIGHLSADRINYKDFRINKGEMIIGQGNNIFIANSNGICLGHAIWANAPFRVDMSGNFYASNAIISGEIQATSGTIGGFTITPTHMHGGSIRTAQNVGSGVSGVVMDPEGLRGYHASFGEVFNLPTDGSAPSFSSGVIKDTVFEINTNAILRTSETVGDGSADSQGVLINNTGLYAAVKNQTLANANVRILSTGEAVFSGNVRGGMTDFMEGEGYFMGLSGGVYKMAVGNPEGNHMGWDNEQLRIKGAIEVFGPLNLHSYKTIELPIPPTNTGLNLAEDFE